MSKPGRSPRRAYDADGREIEPMPLANMREYGVRSVEATCQDCKHEAIGNVDALPDNMPVPDVGLQLRCSECGSKNIATRPNWRDHHPFGRGGYSGQSPPIGAAAAAIAADAEDEAKYEQLARDKPEDGGDETLH